VTVLVRDLVDHIQVTKQITRHAFRPREDLEQPARASIVVAQGIDIEPPAREVGTMPRQKAAQDAWPVE
jgi:hypothetical protein